MSEPPVSHTESAFPGADEMNSALFAHLVMQQSNMALMLLGKTPHPQTGDSIRDVEAAKLFIDLLEMLETKTKGNLSKEESALLKQTLMTLRLSFVEAVESAPAETKAESAKPSAEPSQPAEARKSTPGQPAPAEDQEHRKKFSKKY
jgi:hypothetical protein